MIKTVADPDVESPDANVTSPGSGVYLGRCQLPGAMPGQERVNTDDATIGDEGWHMAQAGVGPTAFSLAIRGGIPTAEYAGWAAC